MASLEFDDEANALYLKLRKGKVASSEPLAENVILDLDDKELVRIGWRTRAEIDERSLMTLILAQGTQTKTDTGK